MRFLHPWVLSLLALLPVYAVFLAFRGRGGSMRFSDLGLMRSVRPTLKLRLRGLLPYLRPVACVPLIMALARPQSVLEEVEIPEVGLDVMICLDTSGSMQLIDQKDRPRHGAEPVTRVEAAKRVASEFAQGRKHDRVGLVVFGSEAFTQCPLTLDHGMVVNLLDHVYVRMAGERTAIGYALAVAVNRLKGTKAKSKAVILVTDGRNNAKEEWPPLMAAKIAKSLGAKVYTIGVGRRGGAWALVEDLMGKRFVFVPEQELDEETLKAIAGETGGIYRRATDPESLEAIFKEIDELEKSEVEAKRYEDYVELFHWPALLGLLLLLTELGLGHTVFRKIP